MPAPTPANPALPLPVGLRHAYGSCDDDHPCRTEHPVAEPVSLLQHVDDLPGLLLVVRLREQRLVHVRVERALGLDLGEPFLLQRPDERAMDEPDAILELRLLVLHGRVERAL